MPTSTLNPNYELSSEQKEHFLEHGFVKIPSCFTREQAEGLTSTMWTRLGFSPTDQSTWTTERTNMPSHTHVLVSDFAPKAWSAMCELLGGEDRISDNMRSWSDGFIVNLGKEEYDPNGAMGVKEMRELSGWHNDGDFFVHHLDSPEQALLVIPLWSDIVERGGGTVVCSDGIKHIARHLLEHPEGVTPWMKSLYDPSHAQSESGDYFWGALARDPSRTRDESFFEMTGEIGDVILLHPFMLHSASNNLLRHVRVITNPPVSLREPFCLNRERKEDYSLVELKTLRDLGMPEGLVGDFGNWRIVGERRGWIPSRHRKMEEMKRVELERLEGLKGVSM